VPKELFGLQVRLGISNDGIRPVEPAEPPRAFVHHKYQTCTDFADNTSWTCVTK